MRDLYNTDPTQDILSDHADRTAPTRRHELDHTDHTDHMDQGSVYLEIATVDHEMKI